LETRLKPESLKRLIDCQALLVRQLVQIVNFVKLPITGKITKIMVFGPLILNQKLK